MLRPGSHFLKVFIVIAIVLSQPCVAGLNRWTTHGPEGGSITTMVVDPVADVVAYAATVGGGVYKTENAGGQWTPMNEGLSDLFVTALAMSPDDHLTLYAATKRGKVFKTVDGGEHWVEVTQPGPGSAQYLAVVTSQIVVLATERGFRRTTNGGETWEISEISTRFTYFLALSPRGVLFAGTFAALYVSENRGESWNRIESAPSATAIAFGRDGSTYLSGSTGVAQSVDGNKTWQFVAVQPEQFSGGTQALHVSNTGRIYLSTFYGRFYEYEGTRPVLTTKITGVRTIAASSEQSQRLYVGTFDTGIHTKLENSTDWTAVNRGLANALTLDVAVAPLDPSLVYAATTQGLFKSSDYGESWVTVDAARTGAVAVNPIATRIVYAGQTQLKKSEDGGTTWNIVRPELASVLALAPSDPATLYAALASGMSKSNDGGETWTSITSNIPLGYYFFYYGFSASSVTVDPSESSTVYVAHETGMHKSTDGGASWKEISTIPFARALTTDPSNHSLVYAAFPRRGVSKSADGGESFAASGLSDQDVTTLAIDASSPSTIYAGTVNGEVYRSDDRGETWRSFGDGLSGAPVQQISIDESGRYVYAATNGGMSSYEISDVRIDPLPDDRLRLPRLLNELFARGRSLRSAFVIPIAGLTPRLQGSFFRTDVTLRNSSSVEQEVLMAWLPQGGAAGEVPFFLATLPASSTSENVPNIARRLGMSGLGTLVFIAVDSAGNLDPSASIDGSCRICSYSDDRRPLCESIGGIRTELFGEHTNARAAGLRHDDTFRTNVGISNLHAGSRRFTVTASGERHTEVFDVFLPPFSLIHTAIPRRDYGELTIDIAAKDSPAPWVFYGSTVNNATGQSSTSVGIPRP